MGWGKTLMESPTPDRRRKPSGFTICNWGLGSPPLWRMHSISHEQRGGGQGPRTRVGRPGPRGAHTTKSRKERTAKKESLQKAPACLLSQWQGPPTGPVGHSRCPVPLVGGKIKDVPKRLKVPGAAAWKPRSWQLGLGGAGERAAVAPGLRLRLHGCFHT